MQNLKYDTNELIHKTETDSKTQRRDLWFPRGWEVVEEWFGSLWLTDESYHICNESTTRPYCLAQGTMFNTV